MCPADWQRGDLLQCPDPVRVTCRAGIARRFGLCGGHKMRLPSSLAAHQFHGRLQFDEEFTPIDQDQLRQQLSTEEVSRPYATG